MSDSNSTGLDIVDVSGRCDGQHVDLAGQFRGAATSPDTATTYISIQSPGFRNELVARRLPSLDVAWRLPLADSGEPHVVDGVGLVTGERLAVSLDRALLYLFRATRDGTSGITALDATTRRPVAFSGPWNVVADGLVPLVPSSGWSRGALVVVGEPNEPGPYRDIGLYLLDPESLTVMDSIPADSLAAGLDIRQVVPTPDGRVLYVKGWQRIVRYDLVERRVTATLPTTATGTLTLMPGGAILVVTDVGIWPDFPGSGRLWLYGPNLEARGTIDVSTPLGGRPDGPTATVTGRAVLSSDGRTVYVSSGTADAGPLYPTQPARLLVVDVVERQLTSAIDWGGYGQRYVLLVLQ